MQMRYLLDRIPNAVLMGSDWPALKFAPLPSHKGWIDLFRNLTLPEGFWQWECDSSLRKKRKGSWRQCEAIVESVKSSGGSGRGDEGVGGGSWKAC